MEQPTTDKTTRLLIFSGAGVLLLSLILRYTFMKDNREDTVLMDSIGFIVLGVGLGFARDTLTKL